ncbi:MAG: prolyl oligopeptidase family serine peptidase [Rhodothermaceae bacterium]|nr:prolyl oligopeptidase family serine peptidase [Rhodothermaceae bacterium]
MNKNKLIITKLTAVVFVFAAILPVKAQHDDVNITYQLPPQELIDLVDGAPSPGTSLDPTRSTMLLMDRPSLPSIEELAQPELRLAGIRVNPATNGGSRGSFVYGMSLLDIETGNTRDITGLPANPRLGNMRWSPDGSRIAFTHTTNDGIELWVAETGDASARRLVDFMVNDAFYGASHTWHPDGAMLYVKRIPANRGPVPVAPLAPSGPVIQQNLGRTTPARTYQDMLQNTHHEDLFDYYFTSEIVAADMNGRVTSLNRTGVISTMSPSPDGNYLMLSTLSRPYSYIVPAFRFPQTTEITDRAGRTVYTVESLPLLTEVPLGFNSTNEGRRSITWRNDAPASIAWVEAQDGGDPRTEAEIRDVVYMMDAPFSGKPVELARLQDRFGGLWWGLGNFAMVRENWRATRTERIWAVSPDSPASGQTLLRERNYEDRYNDPGTPMMQIGDDGQATLLFASDNKTLFMTGMGASPDGNRPFLDTYNTETGDTERLWQSEPPYYEMVVTMKDEGNLEVITTRQSTTEPSNFFLRNLSDGSMRQLTHFEHPTPQYKDVTREFVSYEREDGLRPLPTVIWAYPREFGSADAAGQVTGSPYSFTNIGYWGPQWLVTQGYAVIDNASMPVIGEDGEEPNDTFIAQLIMNAKAAISMGEERGVTDPNRVAVGGHSYGAFMTANLLAHSDLFKAGIARSGAYNRSLTPFGFQAEARTIWDDTELYITMSPFFFAHQIKTPILFIHGEADNNSGTFPLQSERLYQAIAGLGGTTRLVMLPHESHGYRARESVLHMLWETLTWLDHYVKNAEPVTETAAN